MANEWLNEMLPELPHILTRRDIRKFFGSLISPRYLANLDSEKKGPKRAKIGHKVVYRREDFVEWLTARFAAQVTHFGLTCTISCNDTKTIRYCKFNKLYLQLSKQLPNNSEETEMKLNSTINQKFEELGLSDTVTIY